MKLISSDLQEQLLAFLTTRDFKYTEVGGMIQNLAGLPDFQPPRQPAPKPPEAPEAPQ